MSSSTSTESPMNLHQRGLVDACFEEGQYDEGIALLNQLRALNTTPSVSHVRQLLYLSLYPPAIKKQPVDSSLSPSKMGKQLQRLIIISPTTAASARALLVRFALTNSPQGLAPALPSHDCSEVDNEGDVSESFVSKESYCISSAKNCWVILRKGFIHRAALPSPTKKGARRTVRYDDDDDDNDLGTCDVVAEHSWPILDFLLILFERDEIETEACGLPRHSPLLLSQIPAPRSGKGARWEADSPLSVVLFALSQDGDERKRMGARLMQLLINLCSTTHFDFTMFLNSVSNRIYISAPVDFLAMLTSLPPTLPTLRFRIAMLHKFICDGNKSSTPSSVSRPKPQRARPVRRTREDSIGEASSKSPSTSLLNQTSLPPFADIRRSMENLSKMKELLPYSWMQFQLLVSFGIYQTFLPQKARDEEWQNLLEKEDSSQQVYQFLRSDDSETTMYAEILQGLLPSWKA